MKKRGFCLSGVLAVLFTALIFSCQQTQPIIPMFTVTYSLGEGVEGTAPVDNNSYITGQAVTLASAVERSGYTFTAWNDGKADYAAGSSYTMGIENVKFTAQWKKNETKTQNTQSQNLQKQPEESVKKPVFSIAGGTVDRGTIVSINCETSGADIFYTLDGTTPSESSLKYNAVITINESVTINAIAVKSGMNSSEVASASYTVKGTVATPTFSVNDSVIESGTTVTISCKTAGAVIHYTTDGSVPTAASPIYAGEITITTGLTIKAIAVKDEMYDSAIAVKSYTIQGSVETPVFSVTDGAVDYGTQVTITSGTEGAAIYYTADGTTPTSSSTPYAGAITVNAGMTLKAIAVKAGLNDSATGSVTYTIKTYTVTYGTTHGTAPVDATAYHKGQVVTLMNMAGITGWTFKHWTDGSNNYAPGSTITVETSNIVLTAVWTEWEKVSTPAFSVAAGAVVSGTTVTITCTTAGATVYYTTDGSIPTTSSTAYITQVTINSAMTLKAIAVKSGMNDSAVASTDYTVTAVGYQFTESVRVLPAGTDGTAGTSATYVEFGDWPQTIAASNIIFTVNKASNGYYVGSDGNYYAKCLENLYDVSEVTTYSDGTTIKLSSANSYRYFKVEPIKWRVLTTTYTYDGTNKAKLLMAESILTANVPYYESTSSHRNSKYANNYEHSQIRAYLNGISYNAKIAATANENLWLDKGFLQTAFTATAQAKIKTTKVDNSGDSTSDATGTITKADGTDPSYTTDYTCSDTQDKIFLLSLKEVTTTTYGFAAYNDSGTGNTRIRMTTDYAKANNASQSSTTGYGGQFWLRSPSYNYSSIAFFLYDRGDAFNSSHSVRSTKIGVVPAIVLDY